MRKGMDMKDETVGQIFIASLRSLKFDGEVELGIYMKVVKLNNSVFPETDKVRQGRCGS